MISEALAASTAEIAEQLVVSSPTIKTHVLESPTLGLRDRVQVVVLAYETGVVDPMPEQAVASARRQHDCETTPLGAAAGLNIATGGAGKPARQRQPESRAC